MKKITLFIITLLLGNIVISQIPANSLAIYEFTNGSSANTSLSGAADLSGSFTSIADRFASSGDAADISENLNGANLGSININESTLSFWMKQSSISGSQRVVQMYGDNGAGYRLEVNGSSLFINTRVEGGGTPTNGVATATVNIDDGNWHHIVVRTKPTTSFDAIIFELFIDNVSITLSNNIIGPGLMLTNFLTNATFVIDPLDGQYTGDIDDIFIYKSNLTDTEVAQLYNYTPAPPPTRYYVDIDATGNNDGTSWANAFTDLRDAFVNSYQGMEIWVADGTYSRGGTDRNTTFGWTKDSLKVYGGFSGVETVLTERDWMANRTIMSGDIGVAGDNSDNSYVVFAGPIGSSTNILTYALLDGFVIQDGNADFNAAHVYGSTGSAFFLSDYTTKMDFHNCEFSNNNAKYSAFYAYADLTDVEVNVDACIFRNNTGRVGCAVLVEAHGENMLFNVTNSLFHENESIDMGALGTGLGAIVYLEAQNSVNTGLQVNFTNTTFAKNENNGSSPSNFKSTVVCYDAASGGGSKHLDVDNCIFWGNTGDSLSVRENPNSLSSFNSIEINNTLSEFSDFPAIATTSNILTSDPLFTDLVNNDFTLQSGSPAIDAGAQTGLIIPSFDLAGNTRVLGSEIDMGCYEAACEIEVTVTNTGEVLNATTGYTDYQWFKDGVAISGATNDNYTATEDGNYFCDATDNGCTSSSNTITITIATGINDLSFESGKIYPNPTQGIVNLDSKEELTAIHLYDLTGKMLKTFSPKATQIDISEWNAGIYLLEITSPNKQSVVKLIKK